MNLMHKNNTKKYLKIIAYTQSGDTRCIVSKMNGSSRDSYIEKNRIAGPVPAV